jgi:hypothetical protein
MTKRLLVACLIACFFSLSARNGYACSCIKPEVPQAFREASAVFVGEVVEIVEPYSNNPKALLTDRLYAIRFKVETSWKGTVAQEMVVLSDQGRAGCFSWGPFLKGNKYLVYAERKTPDGTRIRNLVVLFSCNRTSLLKNADGDLKALDGARIRVRSKRSK